MFQIREFDTHKLDNSSNTIVDKYESRCEEYYYLKDNLFNTTDYDYSNIYEYIKELNNRVQADTDKLTNWLRIIGVDSGTISEIQETITDLTDYVETNTEAAEYIDSVIDEVSDNSVKIPPEEPYRGMAQTIANTAKAEVETAIKENPAVTNAITEVVSTVKTEVNREAYRYDPSTLKTIEEPNSKATLADLAKAAEESKKSAGDIAKDAFTPDIVKGLGGVTGALSAQTSIINPDLTEGTVSTVKQMVTSVVEGVANKVDLLKDIGKSAGPQIIASYAYGVIKSAGIDYLNNIDKQAFANALNDLSNNIDQKVADYLAEHPNASKSEVQNAIIDGFRDTIRSQDSSRTTSSMVREGSWLDQQVREQEIDNTIAVALGLEYNGIDIPLIGSVGTSANSGLGGLTDESAQKLQELYETIAQAASEAYDSAHPGCGSDSCGCNNACDSGCDSCDCGGDCGSDSDCDSCDYSCSSDCTGDCPSDYCTGDRPCDIAPCGSDCTGDCSTDCSSDCSSHCGSDSCDCSTDGYCDCGCNDPSCGGDNA